MNIKLATDGSCIRNPGPGAFAVVADLNGNQIYKSLPRPVSTSGEMELRAMLEALLMSLTYAAFPIAPLSNPFQFAHSELEITANCRPLTNPQSSCVNPILICSDSEFVVKGINDWMTGWHLNQWHKRPRCHVEIWKRIYTVASLLGNQVDVQWVRSHQPNGCPLNAKADACANTAARTKRPTGGPILQLIP